MSETIEIVPYIAEWPASSRRNAHVVESGGDEERRTLAFRDYIRDHDVVAREHEALERSLAPQFSASTVDSRQAYADAKGELIERVTAQALEEGYPRGLQSPMSRFELLHIANPR